MSNEWVEPLGFIATILLIIYVGLAYIYNSPSSGSIPLRLLVSFTFWILCFGAYQKKLRDKSLTLRFRK